jgi:nitroimidazol reductase NimA-like FMN-containing flavoprotein (pyridoxamine 5'-phosphate oxidase superfamily)
VTLLAELSRDACLDRIAGAEVARVAVCTPLGPRIVPVNFTFDGHHILFRTTPYSELGTYARDADVAVEVDDIAEDLTRGWSVLVIGRAAMVEDPAEIRRIRERHDPTPWASGRRSLYVRVPVRDVTGRHLLGVPQAADGLTG